MGSYLATPRPTALPDTEFTPCAIMLHKMGYRVVAISFESGVVTMTKEIVDGFRYGGYFAVNPYIEERRQELVALLTAHVPNDVCTLMVSLMAQGLVVMVTTDASSKTNGDVIRSKSKAGRSAFQYDGPDLIRRVLVARLGEDIARNIHIADISDVMHHKKRDEILLIHPDHDMVRKARKQHMGAILSE